MQAPRFSMPFGSPSPQDPVRYSSSLSRPTSGQSRQTPDWAWQNQGDKGYRWISSHGSRQGKDGEGLPQKDARQMENLLSPIKSSPRLLAESESGKKPSSLKMALQTAQEAFKSLESELSQCERMGSTTRSCSTQATPAVKESSPPKPVSHLSIQDGSDTSAVGSLAWRLEDPVRRRRRIRMEFLSNSPVQASFDGDRWLVYPKNQASEPRRDRDRRVDDRASSNNVWSDQNANTCVTPRRHLPKSNSTVKLTRPAKSKGAESEKDPNCNVHRRGQPDVKVQRRDAEWSQTTHGPYPLNPARDEKVAISNPPACLAKVEPKVELTEELHSRAKELLLRHKAIPKSAVRKSFWKGNFQSNNYNSYSSSSRQSESGLAQYKEPTPARSKESKSVLNEEPSAARSNEPNSVLLKESNSGMHKEPNPVLPRDSSSSGYQAPSIPQCKDPSASKYQKLGPARYKHHSPACYKKLSPARYKDHGLSHYNDPSRIRYKEPSPAREKACNSWSRSSLVFPSNSCDRRGYSHDSSPFSPSHTRLKTSAPGQRRLSASASHSVCCVPKRLCPKHYVAQGLCCPPDKENHHRTTTDLKSKTRFEIPAHLGQTWTPRVFRSAFAPKFDSSSLGQRGRDLVPEPTIHTCRHAWQRDARGSTRMM